MKHALHSEAKWGDPVEGVFIPFDPPTKSTRPQSLDCRLARVGDRFSCAAGHGWKAAIPVEAFGIRNKRPQGLARSAQLPGPAIGVFTFGHSVGVLCQRGASRWLELNQKSAPRK